MIEPQLEKVRRRAPAELDFDALVQRHHTDNRDLVEEWRLKHPGAEAAVLEIVVPAVGQMRRRLRRYAEFRSAARNTPDFLVVRSVTSFAFIDQQTIAVDAAAARAGAAISTVRLLTVGDALTSAP